MPKISYLDNHHKLFRRFKRGSVFIVIFLLLSFVMGIIGGAGAVLFLSSNSRLSQFLGIENNQINIATTRTEKIRLEESSTIIEAVKKVAPAVVSITATTQIEDFFGTVQESQGGGTGFIVTNDGLILTNKHVAQAGQSLSIMTTDGKTYEGQVAALDPTNDLAIIKVNASGLPVVDLGNSDDLQIGQWVVAIGNALGQLQNTVTAGVISARERQLVVGGGQEEQLNNLLQTDAAINAGNSGGPLINLAGQVVGINTAIASNAQNIGFAIPINQVNQALDSYKKTGKIIKPFLGVRYATVTKEISKKLNLSTDEGAFIYASSGQQAIVSGSPADKAGLKSGDVILEINGEKISQTHPLSSLISQYQPGDEIELKILRDKKESTLKLKLGSID